MSGPKPSLGDRKLWPDMHSLPVSSKLASLSLRAFDNIPQLHASNRQMECLFKALRTKKKYS